MVATLKMVVVYGVVWYSLCGLGNFLYSTWYHALHGGLTGWIALYVSHRSWALHSATQLASIALTVFECLLIIGISFRTLNVQAMKRPGDLRARILFVSGGVGLIFYALYVSDRWPLWGTESLAKGLPSLLATVGAGYTLHFVGPRPPQTPPVLPPSEGVWPPPPHIP